MFFHDRWIDWDQHDPAEREHWIYTCTRSIGIYIYLSLAASAVRPISPCTLVSYREWLATRIESMVVVFSLACIWKSYRFWSNDQASFASINSEGRRKGSELPDRRLVAARRNTDESCVIVRETEVVLYSYSQVQSYTDYVVLLAHPDMHERSNGGGDQQDPERIPLSQKRFLEIISLTNNNRDICSP